ncbi:hypothetical protein [Leptolyngbya sp. FACHB-60]|uniref:hypothetical protein n=1 Tax=unclassified Leptolyngbya TaxID=2650499 RepID=UPI001687DB1C|nr:hypothetical protein [Leptolyngbya sp. FACHB-60]MBD1915050.1 hypothetical protein [Phormidium sp. FACHB-77]MBD2053151.1 hypothetical protein [Leptolyngbya sp. FACHB-60]
MGAGELILAIAAPDSKEYAVRAGGGHYSISTVLVAIREAFGNRLGTSIRPGIAIHNPVQHLAEPWTSLVGGTRMESLQSLGSV